MSILDTIGERMSNPTDTKADIERILRLKKMMNIGEDTSIRTVSDTKLMAFADTYGSIATQGLKRYAELTEDPNEQTRINRILENISK